MTRIIALVALILLLSGAFFLSRSFDNPSRGDADAAALDIKYRYLVVSIEGPADWVKQHRFLVRWQGKTISLPVAFRVPGPAEDVELGAGPEIMKYLVIGNEEVPVTAKQETEFRVGNEMGVAFYPEKSLRAGATAFSLATWVVVCPPDQQGEVSPDADEGQIKRVGNKVERRLHELIDEGRVIDVRPDP
jgi:hypothetical protein